MTSILAFDTSSSACSVALQHQGQVKSFHRLAPMQQTRLILPAIQTLLDGFSLQVSQLDAIAFGCGPGSFTGIRLASSVAQGLAFAADCPVFPVSSLAALAQTAYKKHGWKKMLAAVDARMGDVYFAAYQVNESAEVRLLGEEAARSLKKLNLAEPAFGERQSWCGVGDAWKQYSEALAASLGYQPEVDSELVPHAEAVLFLGNRMIERGEAGIKANEVSPAYLR